MKVIKAAGALAVYAACTSVASADICIAHVYGLTGPLEAYAAQSHIGLMLGLEYATGSTMEIDGEAIIEKDTQMDPARGRALLAEAYGDDDAQITIGPVS